MASLLALSSVALPARRGSPLPATRSHFAHALSRPAQLVQVPLRSAAALRSRRGVQAAAGPDNHPVRRIDAAEAVERSTAGNGVFLLLALNVALFVADHMMHLPMCKALYLHHAQPQWWQFITHQFCHGSAQHMLGNMFYVLVFGRLIEETEGGFGVCLAYLLTGFGAALATYLTSVGQPIVSVGASGAVFGLFAVSVLLRLQRFSIRRLLEAGILGNMVVKQVLDEVRAQASGGALISGMKVSHIAHLGGAMAGVLLVWLLTRLPDPSVNTTTPASPA